MNIEIKKGLDLDENELTQIKAAVFREFKVEFTSHDQSEDKIFFLLKDKSDILSMGALWEVNPVLFNNVEYTFFGVLNVIANKKGVGYGKQVVTEMRKYLLDHNLTGVGFCMPRNQDFYRKCGFVVTTNSTQRFVYNKDGKRITNQDGQVIFYQDSTEKLMEKILANPDEEVSIPTDGLW